MKPKVKRVKFDLNTEIMVIPSDLDNDEVETQSQDLKIQKEIPSKNNYIAPSKKILLRRNSVDCGEEMSAFESPMESDVEVIEEDEDVILCSSDSDSGTISLNFDWSKRAKFIADEYKWIEKYKKSCQQYSFINPLPHGKREEIFPCRFRLEGCTYASDHIRTTVHIHSCDYRPVICTASEECGKIPFTKYLEHIRNAHEATGMASSRRWWYHEQSITGDTPTGNVRLPIYIRKYDGQIFLLNTQILQSSAHWWMTMHGELDKIGNYCISVRVVPRLDKKSENDFLRSSDLDVYLSRQVVMNDVPASSFNVPWDELSDYCYVKPKDKKRATYWRIKVTIRRRKPKSNFALFTMGKEMKNGNKGLAALPLTSAL